MVGNLRVDADLDRRVVVGLKAYVFEVSRPETRSMQRLNTRTRHGNIVAAPEGVELGATGSEAREKIGEGRVLAQSRTKARTSRLDSNIIRATAPPTFQ